MKRIFIKPKPGLLVRSPFNMRIVAPAGEEVNEDTYWLRLARQGDITISEIEEKKDDIKESKAKEAK